jgi:hypothetical protein
MARKDNRNWNLEAFLDSLVMELDKAQDTLAVKGLNRPLSYSVKELELDLHLFPDFDGKAVKFRTAKPGESGASKLSFQLGSITSEQIRRTTAEPISKDDISIEVIEGIDEDVKNALQRHGVKSAKDLKKLEKRDVDLDKVVQRKPGKKKVSYKELAGMINKARRGEMSPRVSRVGLAKEADAMVLTLSGDNLAIDKDYEGFPVAAIDGKRVPVLDATERELRIKIDPVSPSNLSNRLQVALDPYSVIMMNLKPSEAKRNNS